MKTLSVFCLTVLVLLCACVETQHPTTPAPTSPPPTTPPPSGTSNITGNWQFNALPGASTPALAIAGSLTQLGNTVHGALHVDGFSCFDHLTTIPVSGFVRGGKLELTSTSINGMVVTLAGMQTNNTFSGSYTVMGGCGDGERDTISGLQLFSISGQLNGLFTDAAQQNFSVVAQVNQGTGSADGSFALSGTATFDTACFSVATIASGSISFPELHFGGRGNFGNGNQ